MVIKSIELLNGEVRLQTDVGEQPLRGPVAQRLVVELVARVPAGGSVRVLRESLGCAKGALQTNVTRLRKVGLRILNSGDRYRLVTAGVRIDAAEFVATARVAEEDATAEQVRTALALWRSGPSELLRSTPLWQELHEAKAELERRRHRLVRRRLLVVEDQVGDRLCQVLGEYECTVVRDLEGFWEVLPHVDSRFDAALVDLHLRPGYEDRDGEVVVGAISGRTAIPAVVMTYQVPGGIDLVEFQRRYNLVSVVTKKDDGPNGDFNGIVGVMRELFATDVRTRLFEMLEDRLPAMRRRAEKQLRLTGATDMVEMMRLKYGKVCEVALLEDLAALRRAVDAFETEFGLRVHHHGK